MAQTIVLTMIGLVPPLVSKFFIDRVITAGEWHFLLAVLFARIAIPLISSGISFWNSWVITYIGQKLVFDVRLFMYKYLMRLSLRFHDDMGTGKTISRLMGDTSTVQSMVTGNTVSIVNDFVSFFFGLAMIFYLNWKLSLLAFLILPMYWLNYRFFVKRLRRKNIIIRRQWDRIYNQLQERIGGTRLVRSFGKEQFETNEFVSSTGEVFGHTMESTALGTSFSGVFSAIDGIGNTLIFCLGCYFVIHGEMTYGGVTAFMSYMWRVLSPALRFTSLANQIEQMMVSVDRIFEVLDTEQEIKDPEDAAPLPPIRGNVKFEDVWFEYVPGEPVLKGVSLEVPAGTTVALVGHTGCGKTTLTSLLLRYYDPTSGRILIDGQDISKVTVHSLRTQIGQVLQDSVIFHGTARENIGYGIKNPTDEQIASAAKVAEIQEFLESKPDKYDSLIGGKGLKLSVGEKQRMSIARAVVTDPGILVLDEATSSLDSQSEALIQQALENVMQNRTSFVIAHRLSTIVNADLIVVMDKGEIMEMGTHEELLAKDGTYKQLYDQQYAVLEDEDRIKW